MMVKTALLSFLLFQNLSVLDFFLHRIFWCQRDSSRQIKRHHILFADSVPVASQVRYIFNYTGRAQTFTVPNNVVSMYADISGAAGDIYVSGCTPNCPGRGARVRSIIAVIPGSQYNVSIGGMGTVSSGGWNGGGSPGQVSGSNYLGGGGASHISRNGNKIVIAGGGGAAGNNANGGDGGLNGESGGNAAGTGGGGAIGSTGGSGHNANGFISSSGSLGQGGSGGYGGGGGGGYAGGGGGAYGGGAGGGSSYSIDTYAYYTTGYQTASGTAIITFASSPTSQPTNNPSVQSRQPTSMPTIRTYTFSFTGTVQVFMVPLNVRWITVTVIGASAGYTGSYGTPGHGALVKATIQVGTGFGTVLYIYVGGQGSLSTTIGTGVVAGGWNGGGNGIGSASGGGGASDIRLGGMNLTNRILVAGGGGGYYPGGGCSFPKGGDGGLIGSDGDNPPGGGCGSGTGGGGGTASAGGRADVPGTPGTLGVGGNGVNVCSGGCGSGGGGGGYYGGNFPSYLFFQLSPFLASVSI
jgi:hypothetical protein